MATNVKTNPDTIILKGDPILKEYPLEAPDIYGVGAITPGMLVQQTLTGTIEPHSSAAGACSPLFAVEALNFSPDSKTMGGIDDDYDTDDQTVKTAFCRPGDEVYALLEAGTGNDTGGAGVLLNSNGAGLLQVGTTNAVARSLEDVDNDPGSGGLAKRIRVEVL